MLPQGWTRKNEGAAICTPTRAQTGFLNGEQQGLAMLTKRLHDEFGSS